MSGPESLKNLLRRYQLKPNFTYGQNFLVDETVLADIVAAARLTSADCVLEIGPGIGNLTERLCQQAGFVLSVEKDPQFVPILKNMKKRHKNFWYEIADVLEFDFAQALSTQQAGDDSRNGSRPTLKAVRYKVVANIPYYITGKILQMLLTAKHKPASITLLTQREVAESLAAAAGDLSVLAISVQVFGQPKIIRVVAKDSFYPAPKVDSAIVHIDLFSRPRYHVSDEKIFFQTVKACFAGKRKQIHNTLTHNLKLDKTQVEEMLIKLKINPAARPQELSIDQWVALSELLRDT